MCACSAGKRAWFLLTNRGGYGRKILYVLLLWRGLCKAVPVQKRCIPFPAAGWLRRGEGPLRADQIEEVFALSSSAATAQANRLPDPGKANGLNTLKARKTLKIICFIAPIMVFAILFVYYPFIRTLINSLCYVNDMGEMGFFIHFVAPI